MSARKNFFYKLSLYVAICGIASISAVVSFGQTASPQPGPVVEDWSHHHLVFSNPGTYADALKNGTVDKWYKITNDPRYKMQQRRRSMGQRPVTPAPDFNAQTAALAAQSKDPGAKPREPRRTGGQALEKDWSQTMGSGGIAASLIGVVGSLSSGTISGSSTLTVDGVAFDASAPTAETATITFGSTKPANTSYVTVGSVTYTISTVSITSAPSTGCEVYSATGSTGATSLYDAIAYTGAQGDTNYRCASSITAANSAVTASLSTSTIHLTAATAGLTGFTFSDGGTTNFTTFTSTAGTNGSSTSPNFQYWAGNTYAASSVVATNIAAAVNANGTVSAVITATGNSPASGDITFTAKSTGVAGNGYAVTAGAFTAFSPTTANLSGGSGATVQPNTYPAKFSFSASTASCANDFVVYPTGAAGAAGAASIIAYNNLYVGAGGCETTNPTVYWAYNTGGAVTTSPTISYRDGTGSQVAFIQVSGGAASLVLLKWAAGPAGETFTGGLTSGSKTVTRSPGTFSTSEIGAQITDTTHSSYIPSGTTITAVNGSSATMSANATTTDSSEALAIHAEATATPGVPITATNANYHSCTAPCMTTLLLSADDTFSSPFYDYTIGSDTLYVGDDLGNLHQFTGVFNGTPGENVGGGWPVGLGSNKLSSPVYDGSTYVLVGDMGGSLYSVKAATAAFTTASGLGDAIADAPLLNGTAGTAFAFVTTSGTYSESGENAIYGFATAFANWSPSNVSEYPGVVALGTGGAGYYLYAGALDNVYYQSSSGAGNLYVVGNTGAVGGATLYQAGISGNALSGTVTSVVAGLTFSGTGDEHGWPSPVTEFCNPGSNSACALNGGATATTTGIDYVFFSVNRGNKTGCTTGAGNGCILSYNVSTPTSVAISSSGLNVTTPATNGCWATGGIVIDNGVPSGTQVGASQIYFINLNGSAVASSGCTAGSGTINAVQASQSSP